ncbi:hypothetical protein [Xenorhabdus szentirmaii]|uniref:hypothetical protein n=1 Tax=Xenorhabdus szentirmaii TaxID=290112 RepID=UPI0019AA47C0|nr:MULTISPECIES: hypothetical protein [unclassified Xenorhabdus]MBD2790710.1 hypothetical protein [Xenorhabdus sp. CUL]MBD2824058.1 hypothetical protein [Xenorhabdus sp. 5]
MNIKKNFKTLLISTIIFPTLSFANNHKIEITQIIGLRLSDSNDRYIMEECKRWKLTEEEIDNIFKMSNEYEYNPYHSFMQSPCDIKGKAKLHHEIWDFSITGGGIITLTRQNKEIYLGCDILVCEPFFILPTFNAMEP